MSQAGKSLSRWPKLEMAAPDAQIRWRERPGLRVIAALPLRAP